MHRIRILLFFVLDKNQFVGAKQDGGTLVSFSDVSSIVSEGLQPLVQSQQGLMRKINALEENLKEVYALQKKFLWWSLTFLALLLLLALYIILGTVKINARQEL